MTQFNTARIAILSLLTMLICSACGQLGGGDARNFEGYWVGEGTFEETWEGEVIRQTLPHSVVEISAQDDELLVLTFENFANEQFSCVVPAIIDTDGQGFEVDKTPCYSSDSELIELKGKGELKGEGEIDLDIDIIYTDRDDNEVYNGTMELELELF